MSVRAQWEARALKAESIIGDVIEALGYPPCGRDNLPAYVSKMRKRLNDLQAAIKVLREDDGQW